MMQMSTETFTEQLSKQAGWSIAMGVLTAAVGILMIIYPMATATASTVVLGAALIVISVAQFVFAFTSETPGNFFLKLLLGILYGIAGVALVAFPSLGVVSLTGLIGAMLIAESIVVTVLAFALPADTPRGWFFLSAFASGLLGVLILAQWPSSSTWAIGTMVGVAVLMNGISQIVVSAQVRHDLRELKPKTV
jgi:uncharacterized membrane protein HdeD (DUF308 family)